MAKYKDILGVKNLLFILGYGIIGWWKGSFTSNCHQILNIILRTAKLVQQVHFPLKFGR
jgi:hypothetical protein